MDMAQIHALVIMGTVRRRRNCLHAGPESKVPAGHAIALHTRHVQAAVVDAIHCGVAP